VIDQEALTAELVSGRLRADTSPVNPNAEGVRAYFGADASRYDALSPATHAARMQVPVLLANAQYENPLLDLYALEFASNLARELAFFNGPGGTTFERPYGWAWLLELQAELVRLRRWHGEVAPLADELADRFVRFLEASAYPVRAGTHGNTAFASILALDYARTAGRSDLGAAVETAARRWYLDDRDYPVAYEPSGDDFLSPALVEAVLMKRILPDREWRDWLNRFLPHDLGPLSRPPAVLDHADAKQSHLDGLCLSRAWCFTLLGFEKLSKEHSEAGMPHVVGGDFAGEHWLASFALLALSAATLKTP
jgi:hypothetical protein